jgi:ferredoxin
MDLARIDTAAAAQGLSLRGAFHPLSRDGVPAMPDGRPVATLVLLGNVGPGLWGHFAAGSELTDGGPDPLDRWSERVIGALGRALGARPLFPFGGPPYLPFIAWAKRAEPVAESPLGMLIHPEHGLWHAYRGALAFAERLELPAPDTRPRPCDSCAGKPCLTACPVGAFGAEGYDVAACVGHISGRIKCAFIWRLSSRPAGRTPHDRLHDPAQDPAHRPSGRPARRPRLALPG